jgi:transposase
MGACVFRADFPQLLPHAIDHSDVRIQDEPNLEQLRAKALVLLQENERLSKKVVDLLRENLSLKGMTPEQLQQALLAIDVELNKVKSDVPQRSPSTERRAPDPAKKERKPQTGHGPTEQPRLRVIPEVHDLDEADRKCASCGGHLDYWKGQDDETEEVDVVERHFVLKKHVRKKYRCQCGCVEMAEMPARLVPGGRYSNDFAVEVAIAKYVDHLPLERQVRIMAREGLVVESQTLWDQTAALAQLFEVAWRELRADAICSPVLGFDETSWEVMTKGSASKKSWTMWQLSTRRVVYYAIAPARDTEEGTTFLDGFKGIAVGDAYIVHKSMAKTSNHRLAFCWVHARRTFIKAEANDPIRARQFIEMVQELYAVEAQAPPGPDGDEERRRLRNEKSQPITKTMKTCALNGANRGVRNPLEHSVFRK